LVIQNSNTINGKINKKMKNSFSSEPESITLRTENNQISMEEDIGFLNKNDGGDKQQDK
jgi:hypothetical protein